MSAAAVLGFFIGLFVGAVLMLVGLIAFGRGLVRWEDQ